MTERYTFTPKDRTFQTSLFTGTVPWHRRSDTYITPNRVVASSMTAAIAYVRSLRRVRSVPEDGWLVRDAWDEYDHNIILHRIGMNEPELICQTCPARRKAPCWAVAKVAKSRSYTRLLKLINTHQQETEW